MYNIVLAIIGTLNPHKGGVGRSTYKLSRHFLEKGFPTKVICFGIQDRDMYENIPLVFVPEPLTSIEAVKKTKKILKEHNCNIIINQMGSNLAITNLLSKTKPEGCKIINTLRINPLNFVQNYRTIILNLYQGSWFRSLIDNPLVWFAVKLYHIQKQRKYYKTVFKLADRLILLSPGYKKEVEFFVQNYPKEKLIAFPNPFIINNKKEEEIKKNIVLYVGRINYQQKRTDLLVDIWEKVSKTLTEWELWIVGYGQLQESLEQSFQEKGIGNVRFWGFQNPDPFYKQAKIFVMTSAFEGFGNVLIEAQNHGVVPVLFDSYSAAGDIINDGIDGFLIPPFNTALFADKIIVLANDIELQSNMSKNARANAARFDIEAVGILWLNLFEELHV
jgi:glycosyltransferase involved in cell wall biosynthesis